MLTLEELVFLAEVEFHDVTNTEACTGNLVGVGGTYALEGGADFGVALGLLVGGIEHTVRRQDEMRLF